MERLYASWRHAYVTRSGPHQGCVFCTAQVDAEAAPLIVHQGHSAFVILNLFPYNAGHLMICPYRHVADYTELSESEVAELGAFTQKAMRVVREVSGAHGFNIGMNQGAVSGAGIAGHLHQHVVPRWGGDSNFMPIIGGTKVIPQLLNDTRDLLAAAWEGE